MLQFEATCAYDELFQIFPSLSTLTTRGTMVDYSKINQSLTEKYTKIGWILFVSLVIIFYISAFIDQNR